MTVGAKSLGAALAAALLMLGLGASCGPTKAGCDSTNCSGCCSSSGECYSGVVEERCGSLGARCEDCGSARVCRNGQCRLPTSGTGGGAGTGGGGGSTGGGGGSSCASVQGRTFAVNYTPAKVASACPMNDYGVKDFVVFETSGAMFRGGWVCSWVQTGCQLALNCDQSPMQLRKSLTIAPDGNSISGTGFVEGSPGLPAGCRVDWSISMTR
jgi:hypothetical protein